MVHIRGFRKRKDSSVGPVQSQGIRRGSILVALDGMSLEGIDCASLTSMLRARADRPKRMTFVTPTTAQMAGFAVALMGVGKSDKELAAVRMQRNWRAAKERKKGRTEGGGRKSTT